MKIADFFVALGFDIKGEAEVGKTDKSVQSLNLNSLKLLASVTALNTAFYAMIATATKSAVDLHRFAITTGQSTDEIQRWKLAAERGNVAGAGMVEAVHNIQRARADLLFGNGEAAAPWMLLGIDPRQDPFIVLDKLRERIKGLDPAIAGKVLGQTGFSQDMLYLLKQPNFGVPRLPGSLNITRTEIDRLAMLGGAWKEFLYYLGQVGTRFSAQFAEPLVAALKNMGKLLDDLGKFVDWLEKGSAGATAFKYGVIGLLVALGSINVVLAAVMAGPFGVFIATVGSLGAVLGLLILTVQDFWVACRGGESAFDWNKGLVDTVDNVKALAEAMQWVIDVSKDFWDGVDGHFNKDRGYGFGKVGEFLFGNPEGFMANLRRSNEPLQRGGLTHTSVTQHMTFNGGEVGSPDDVGRIVRRAVTDAFAQTPQPTR